MTQNGLEDQLLGEVVKKERADVEEKKNRLVISMVCIMSPSVKLDLWLITHNSALHRRMIANS